MFHSVVGVVYVIFYEDERTSVSQRFCFDFKNLSNDTGTEKNEKKKKKDNTSIFMVLL